MRPRVPAEMVVVAIRLHDVPALIQRDCCGVVPILLLPPGVLLVDALDIAIIAGVRFGTTEPYAGGLERHTDVLARELVRNRHRVTVFAGSRDDTPRNPPPYSWEPLIERPVRVSDAAREDVSMPPDAFMVEHDAYLDLFDRLRDRHFDVVHNNSVHYLPVISRDVRPVIHTLHTPPTPWLESAHRIGRRRRHGATVSVSFDNARRWRGIADEVIHNGVDLDRWKRGPGGGGYAFWSGRVVPEKGAHLAVAAAKRAGMPLVIAGPVYDRNYFEQMVEPALGVDCQYVGHCGADELATLLGASEVALVTPRWDEPFGLVVAEALACGTPVAAFRRGAVPELLGEESGVCVAADDVDALASALGTAAGLSRERCRVHAERNFSAQTMASRYEMVYEESIARRPVERLERVDLDLGLGADRGHRIDVRRAIAEGAWSN